MELCGSLQEEPGSIKTTVIKEETWLTAYKNSIKTPDEIPVAAATTPEEKESLNKITQIYHMRIPQYYFSLIKEPANPQDPLRRQCLPSIEETYESEIENIDPLGEEKTSPTPYLVHRYPDRVLLLVTSICFMYCRHCTRKRLWKNTAPDPSLKDISQALTYIKANPRIREIIISGGDPLTLNTERLDYILCRVSQIKSIEAIRIGTRAPIVLPQRIDTSLCSVLKKYANLWINLQFNHPREITPMSTAACKKLRDCGIALNNQSVLLKGVNDDAEIIKELCAKLQSIGVRPYYLFQCDPVVGAAHFRTSLFKGVEIIEKMRGHTSGMCVPTFVIDGINGKGKVPLAPNYLVSTLKEGVLLKNYKNDLFFYDNPRQERSDRETNTSRKTTIDTIGIIFNLKKGGGGDEEEEYDEITTIESLKTEIEKYNFKVKLFEQTADLQNNLFREKPDFAINIAEGIGSYRGRESQAPAILESLGIPYSGSDPIALGITLDKTLTNRILKSHGIPVPEMFTVNNAKDTIYLKNIFRKNKEFIVKPRWEGSSKGILLNSLVNNFSDLRKKVKEICSNYRQPAVIEEFITNDEITAGIYGNEFPKIIGMMKISPREGKKEKFIYSLEIKRNWENAVIYTPEKQIPYRIKQLIKKYAQAAYRALELKDLCRIDFRIGNNTIPKIIDVNPLPGLSPRYSDLPILFKINGGSYEKLIEILLKDAFKRYHILFNKKTSCPQLKIN